MKSSSFLWLVRSLIFIVVFDVVIFLITDRFTTNVWLSLGFIHFSYFMLVLSLWRLLGAGAVIPLWYPEMGISLSYFLFALGLGITFMIFKDASIKLSFSLQLILVGIFGIVIISNILANRGTSALEEESRESIAYMKNAASEVDLILRQIKEPVFRRKVEKIYDAIRSCQVKSHHTLAGVERDIVSLIGDLKKLVNTENYSESELILVALQKNIDDRNSRISLLKN